MVQEPEQVARILINQKLQSAGWIIQDRNAMNLYARVGVAVCEFPVTKPNGNPRFADYMLFVDRKAVGVLEAKRQGETLSGVADQSVGYAAGLAANIPRVAGEKLPFLYLRFKYQVQQRFFKNNIG
jgi:type I restriction enzyme R subunit